MGCLGHRNGRYRHSRWLNVSFTGTTVYLFNSFIITGLNIPIEAFRIKVSDRSYASTSGNLQIGVKQGDQNSCQTVVETFTSPQTNVLYLRDDKSLFGSCVNTWFQPSYNMPLQIRVLSDSGNDSYLDKIGVKINGVWRDWVWGYQKKVNKNEGNEWQTVISAGTISLMEL